MNPHALSRMRSVLQRQVDQGLLPGAVALVYRHGQTVLHEAVGALRPGQGAPAMATDSVFRIYSMTKPIASLVALMLMEEGRLLLSHPVAHYLPAFAGQRVYDHATGTAVPAAREATVHDLLRHTAGLSYAWDVGTVPDAYRAARIGSRRLGNAAQAAAADIEADIQDQFKRFPRLGERQQQMAGTMSGGEQQMLAIARALMARPQLLLLDEPSLGLAPLIVKEIFDTIRSLRTLGVTILLVEQMANQALAVADRGYVLETGRITLEGPGRELRRDPKVRAAYLGGH